MNKQLFTIVVADDEPIIRSGLAENVPWHDLGFELIESCENGRDVLELARSRPVDAVLSDIRMPEVSGIELARTIRREAPETMLLFLTAHSDFEYAQAAINYGVWKYLVKPLNYAELLETLRELYQEIAGRHGGLQDHSTDPLVRAVDDYIACRYRNASLSEISAKLELSQEHVSRVYYQRTGFHFSDELKRVRMEEAARLLEHTKYRVAEISDIVGYSSPKNFTRCFSRYFGISPRRHRNNSS